MVSRSSERYFDYIHGGSRVIAGSKEVLFRCAGMQRVHTGK